VLLDEPYPENLPVVECCPSCNLDLSLDEEYFACLIDCVLAGSTGPEDVARSKVKAILTRKPGLVQRLSEARNESAPGVFWHPETNRVRNVVLKLARGHSLFELHEPHIEEPQVVDVAPLSGIPEEARMKFEAPPSSGVWPEVGSRAIQRAVQGWGKANSPWVVVQPGRYRYLAATDGGALVRFVISEYLACEVRWD
jgi:hypothetical protein